LIKVVVSDEISNPQDACTAEAVSGIVIVDNTAPQVELPQPFRTAPTAPVRVKCEDNLSRITSAEYRIDENDWIAAAAADGIFDSMSEEILIKPENIPAGNHKLQVRCRDLAGNETVKELSYKFEASKTEETPAMKEKAPESPEQKGKSPSRPPGEKKGSKPKRHQRKQSVGKE